MSADEPMGQGGGMREAVKPSPASAKAKLVVVVDCPDCSNRIGCEDHNAVTALLFGRPVMLSCPECSRQIAADLTSVIRVPVPVPAGGKAAHGLGSERNPVNRIIQAR